MAKVTWSLAALRRLRDIYNRIAQDNPDYAPEFVNRIVHATDRLASVPNSGRRVPEDRSGRVREAIFRDYQIVYMVKGESVVITTVFHGTVNLGERLPSAWDLTDD